MTRYTCLACRNWLAACRCDSPVPSEDEQRPVDRAKTWTKADVAELLRREAQQQETTARERLSQHMRTLRRRPG